MSRPATEEFRAAYDRIFAPRGENIHRVYRCTRCCFETTTRFDKCPICRHDMEVSSD